MVGRVDCQKTFLSCLSAIYGQDGPCCCCYKWLPKNVPCLNSLNYLHYTKYAYPKTKIWMDENLDSRSRRNNWTPKIVPKVFVLPPPFVPSWSKYDLLYIQRAELLFCCASLLYTACWLLGIYTTWRTHLSRTKISFSFSSFCFYVRASSSLDGEGKVDLFSLAFFSPSSLCFLSYTYTYSSNQSMINTLCGLVRRSAYPIYTNSL